MPKTGSRPVAPAQRLRRKHDDGPQKLKDTSHGDAHDAEWQQQEPYDGIEHQGQERQLPAEHQKDAPQYEGHRFPLTLITLWRTKSSWVGARRPMFGKKEYWDCADPGTFCSQIGRAHV